MPLPYPWSFIWYLQLVAIKKADLIAMINHHNKAMRPTLFNYIAVTVGNIVYFAFAPAYPLYQLSFASHRPLWDTIAKESLTAYYSGVLYLSASLLHNTTMYFHHKMNLKPLAS